MMILIQNLVNQKIKKYLQWPAWLNRVFIFGLSLVIVLNTSPFIQAQTPNLPNNVTELIRNGSRPLSGQIGNLVYAPVKVDGIPLFYVAVPASVEDDKGEKATAPLQDRVTRIQNNIKEIIERGFDPNTLQVYPSVLNGQTVIRVSDPNNLKPQTIGTITENDAQLHGQAIAEMAPEAANQLRQALIRARQERQPESLQAQGWLAVKLFLSLALISLILLIIQSAFTRYIFSLKKALAQFLENAQDTDLINAIPANHGATGPASEPYQLQKSLFLIFEIFSKKFQPQFIVSPQSEELPEKKIPRIISKYLYCQTREDAKLIYQRQIKIIIFLRRLLSFFQLLLWLRGLAFILALFPYSRELGVQIAGAPMSLILIWLIILVLLKMSDFFIDKMLQIWEEDINLRDKNSNRGILRIPTISNALKGICLVLLISTGIILSLGIFDFPIATILAGAGIIGFAISFGSQSLIKDVISGVINLFNDSYAVGDFVIIANDEGLVEDLNLFVTRLRSSNGDLITIPNGSVGIVRNQTKDWSRVDYSIQISYDADIQQALGILRQVAEELYHDSQWHSLISEPPDLKGVEDLSHLGVRLRVWLKTKPGEQWIVARELRLRLKSAFEAAGISIGIPQQAFLFQNSGDRLSGE